MDLDRAFLEAVLRDPEDDTPRLVYADWLDERGQADRAEFIRLQCQLEQLPQGDERRGALEAREFQLLAGHRKGWAGPIKSWARRWEFRRGFVEGVRMRADAFVRHADELFTRAPLRRLDLEDTPAEPGDLAACPHLARLRALAVPSCDLLLTLLAASRLTELRELQVRDYLSAGHDPRLLKNSARILKHLESVRLPRGANPGLLLNLLDSSLFQGLREIHVRFGMVEQIPAAIVGQLECLVLERCELGGYYLEPLAQVKPTTMGLSTLRLPGNPGLFRGQDAASLLRVLTASPLLRGLHTLDLRLCGLTFRGGMARLKGTWPRGLVHLSLSDNPLGPLGAICLVGSQALHRVRRLDLASCGLEDGGLQALAERPGLPQLSALDVARNGITARGIRTLVQSPLVQRLHSLDLSNNRLENEGAAAILSASWPRLVHLNVRHNHLGPRNRAALRARFGYAVRY
jgi:uncharacterized protein (TIGR02996 family)